MYLIDDSISCFLSSWDIDTRGGKIKCLPEDGAYYYSMKNTNGKFPLSMKRILTTCRSGNFVFETAINLNREMSGFSIAFADENDATFLNINTNGQGMYLNGTYLAEYEKDCMERIKLKFSLDSGVAEIMINAEVCGSINFSAHSLKSVTITAPNCCFYEARIYFMRLYSGYDVHEEFSLYGSGKLPKDIWAAEGEMYVKKKDGLSVPYDHCLYMKQGSRLFCSIPHHNKTIAEFMTLSDNFTVKVGQLVIKSDKNGIFANNEYIGEVSLAYWCMFRIEFNGEYAVVKLNGRRRTQIPCPVPENLEFISGYELWLDKILVYEMLPEPEDYVPKPNPVMRSDVHVGMMACSIWREGNHFGWDKINPFPERKPYNGFYDEGEIEEADWEIKYMCEHGIEYEIFCWFAPRRWVRGAIEPRMPAIEKAFFNAKYINDLKFTFMWENGASKTSVEGFYENLVPFWIEYYFKHPQFLKVDNKPVIYIYTHWGLRDHFGSVEEIKRAMDFLDSECKRAGFDGITVILSLPQRIKGAFEEVRSMGIKNVFSYTWNTDSRLKQQQDVLTKQYNYNVLDVVPTVSMGYDTKPWLGNSNGYYIPPKDLSELIRWTRNVHNKRYDNNSIASHMIVLDNWNEYGEGHYFMPTGMTGFKYLDAVLEGLELDNIHDDVYPNEKQRDRICHLYNKNRILYKTCYIAPEPSDKPLIGWYFKNDHDLEQWKPNGGISGLKKIDAALLGHTESTGFLEIKLDKPVKVDNASNIRITLKLTNHNFDQYRIMFTTEENPEFCDKNSVVGYAYESFARAWILPVNKCEGWHGSITGLRIIPNTTGGDFELVSVEIMENKRILPELFVNGERIRVTYADKDMIAINTDILDALYAVMSVDEEGRVTLKSCSGHKILLSADSCRAVLDGKEIMLVNNCKVIDRFFLVPFVEIFGYLGYNTKYEGGIVTADY